MCFATMAVVGSVITGASAAFGGIAAGKAASYQSQVAKNNALIARQNAGYAASAGAAQAEQEGLRASTKLSGLRAGQAALGVDANSGSAADVQTSQREVGALDQATVSNKAAQEVYGYASQATSFEAQSRLDSAEAIYDPIEGILSGTGSALSGAGQTGLAAQAGGNSLMSGRPSVGSNNSWMQGDDFGDAAASGVFG